MKKVLYLSLFFLMNTVQAQEVGNPLINAVRAGDYSEVQRLLSLGINVNAQDQFTAPLHYAAENNDARLIDLLVRNGARINLQDREGKTPLHYAAINKSRNAAELLLSKGADPDISDRFGKRPTDYSLIQQLQRHVGFAKIKFSETRMN